MSVAIKPTNPRELSLQGARREVRRTIVDHRYRETGGLNAQALETTLSVLPIIMDWDNDVDGFHQRRSLDGTILSWEKLEVSSRQREIIRRPVR